MAEGLKPLNGQAPGSPQGELHGRLHGAAALSGWGLGLDFILSLLLPGALGFWLDGRFGTRPALMLVGGGIGFAAGLFRMLRQSRELMR